jgi:hypothetical protein
VPDLSNSSDRGGDRSVVLVPAIRRRSARAGATATATAVPLLVQSDAIVDLRNPGHFGFMVRYDRARSSLLVTNLLPMTVRLTVRPLDDGSRQVAVEQGNGSPLSVIATIRIPQPVVDAIIPVSYSPERQAAAYGVVLASSMAGGTIAGWLADARGYVLIGMGAGWYGGVRIWNRWIAFERDRGRK